MATFAKMLRIQPSGGTEETAEIYSTTDEAGGNYMFCSVDGTDGYIALGDTDASNATSCRVTKSGTTYAILTAAEVVSGYDNFNGKGTYSWTCPSGVSTVSISVVAVSSSKISSFTSKYDISDFDATLLQYLDGYESDAGYTYMYVYSATVTSGTTYSITISNASITVGIQYGDYLLTSTS